MSDRTGAHARAGADPGCGYGASGAGQAVTFLVTNSTVWQEDTPGRDGLTVSVVHPCGTLVEPCTTMRVRFAGWPAGLSIVSRCESPSSSRTGLPKCSVR